MYKLVKNYMEKNNMIQDGDFVLAGVSGGGDSMAMLDFLRRYREERDFSIRVVHVHHGIRHEEADRDCNLVKETCKTWGIPCSVYTYNVPKLAEEWKMGTEETGRLVRRQAFQKEKQALNIPEEKIKIALAHNKNDLAETMLHHLARGTGLKGLSSMRPVQGDFIRPVLCLEKEQIVHYLKEEHIPNVLDSSNLSDVYTRNRIRHHILPLMEKEINSRAVSHMAETAGFLAEAEDYFQKEGRKLLGLCSQTKETVFFPDAFFEQEKIVQKYAILEVLEKLAGKRKDFTAVHLRNFMELSHMCTGRQIHLPYGLLAKRTYKGIVLRKQKEDVKKAEGKWELTIPGELICPYGVFSAKIFSYEKQKIIEKKYTKWLDYDRIKNKLYIRTRKQGDYLIIDEKGSRKKLSRVMIDDKIPGDERGNIPLVAAEDEILWITGGRMNEKYKITSRTKRVLEVQYQGGKGYE